MKKIYILLLFVCMSIANLSAQFAASNFSLLSNISPEVGAGIKYSGCWGWTDTLNDKEYAIAGSITGTYFIDVTNPYTPTVSAFYPATASNGNWREMKSYKNYLYVVNDNGAGTTGLQIFDMSTLPATVTLVSQNMNLFRRGHAAWIDGNKLYVSGITYSNNTTSSLDVYSLATPTAPVLLRQLKQDYPSITYIHDSFVRNDTVYASCAYQGLYVYRLTAANTFTQLGSLVTYPGSGYNHATALTPNGQHLVMLDEVPVSLPIKVLDVTNLANIVVTATANQFPQSTPHNPWMVSDQYCFVSAYQDGTQLWDISNPNAPVLAAYFDTYPVSGGNNNTWPGGAAYNGQWGLYPYFPSKNIFALDRNNGVFMINTHLFANPEINIIGNAINIPDGSVATGTNNNTDFGSVIIPGNAINNFVIQNTGLASLNISSITITGANASQFSIVGPAAPFTVSSNGAQVLGVKFMPLSAGTKTAMINLSSNDINEGSYDFVVTGFAISTVDLKKQTSENFDLMIYPNPASDHLTIKYNDMKAEDATLKLINSLGQVVMEERLSTDCCSKDLNIAGFPKGIYLIQVKGKTVSEVKKVMIY
ncbi:MAG: choice-of-anchor B family protein [Bacteroidota bacterium]|nr:choice-of-anchor B family protein [Bacteroidota bacterium]